VWTLRVLMVVAVGGQMGRDALCVMEECRTL
jgi:hypothetical protein